MPIKSMQRKYHSARRVQQSNRKITETEPKCISLTHICMTFPFPGLVRVLQEKEENNKIEERWNMSTKTINTNLRFCVVFVILLVDKLA
jgi:hypothetical protein